jgi:putative peptidoglycan lipid II flippase
MVKKFFSLLGKEIGGLHEAAYLLGAATIASSLLALVRDKILAFKFGAGPLLDLYYSSFRISDMVYATIASTVAASILVPFLIKKAKASGDPIADKNHEKYFIDHVFSAFFVGIIGVCIIVFFLMPYIIPRLLPGYANSPQLGLLITASRIMLLSPILLGMSNFLASITQMYNRFLIYAISPLLYNLGIIFGTLFLYPFFGIYGLVIGVVIGAAMHMGIQIPFVVSRGLMPQLRAPINWKEIREVVLVSFPRTLTLSSAEIAEFFLIALATLMGAGAVSIFNFAWNLQSVPLGIIGVSYASAAFPAMAKLYEAGDIKHYVSHMATCAKHIIFWSMPVMVLFIVLRAQIVRVILGAGQFTWDDTRLTAAMLAIFTISVVGQGLILLFVRAYYAEGKTKRPLLVNCISAVVIILLAYVLRIVFTTYPMSATFVESLFKVTGVAGSTVLVLSLAYTLGILLNTYLHWHMFHHDYGGWHGEFTPTVFRSLIHNTGAAIIGGFVAFLALRPFGDIFNLQKTYGVFLQGFCAGLIGLAVWLAVLWLLKNEELHDVWKTLHTRIWKAKIEAVDQEPL